MSASRHPARRGQRIRTGLALTATCLGAICAMTAAVAALAQDDDTADAPPTVAAALTDEVVQVTSRFTGARIVLYGVVNGLEDGDDVVVVVRGPRQPMRVMRKQHRFGIWINGAPARFEGAPSYYATASTRPIEDIAPPDQLSRHDVGIQHAPLRSVGDSGAQFAAQIAEYRRAIVRLKAADGLYSNVPDGVDVLDGGLFRAAVNLPPGSPTGDYHAEVFVFRAGRVAAQYTVQLRVEKVGLERFVYTMAHEHSLLYGLIAVLIASLSGFAAAEAFRRR